MGTALVTRQNTLLRNLLSFDILGIPELVHGADSVFKNDCNLIDMLFINRKKSNG